jgi:hypothetical protein
MDVPVNIPPSQDKVTGPESNDASPPTKPSGPRLVDLPVTNQNEALNVMIGFMTTAQKRGAFTIQESAKLWECIKVFTNPQAAPPTPPSG